MTGSQLPSQADLLALKGKSLPLPKLLELFGVRMRNPQTVPIITAAFHDVGLTTVPSFATCGRNVVLLVVAEELVAGGHEDRDDEYADMGLLPGTLPQRACKIEDIPSATAGVESLLPNATLAQATHIMRTKNYSQLPVISGTSDLRGVITWSSITARYQTQVEPSLDTAMVKDSFPIAELHQELFPRLPELTEHGYLLVRNAGGHFRGIITGADIAMCFQATAQPFYLVGEIEFRLRRILGVTMTPEAICKVQKSWRQTGNIADLEFGQYIRLFKADPNNATACADSDANWQALGWPGVDRIQFVHALDRVRMTRNDIAHFSSSPLTPERIAELREFSGLLKQLM